MFLISLLRGNCSLCLSKDALSLGDFDHVPLILKELNMTLHFSLREIFQVNLQLHRCIKPRA